MRIRSGAPASERGHVVNAASSPARADDGRVQTVIARLRDRLRRDDDGAQFVRFVGVGGAANLLYGLLFVLLADVGSQTANLAGSIASSALANELHRRLTFHAGGRVSWLRAQWEGGGLALAGMVATATALARFDALVADSGAVAQLLVVAVVTGTVGLVRFVVLRWVFRTANDDHGAATSRRDRSRQHAGGWMRPRHLAAVPVLR